MKILGTGLLVALPLTLMPAPALASRLAVNEQALPYLRLYGVAVLALLVGYAFGFSAFSPGQFPWGVVTMGIVSNGLGTITLLLTGGFRAARGMTVLIATIAVALSCCALNPELALRDLSDL